MGTGSLTVSIGSLDGQRPIEASFVVINAVTGKAVGPENGTYLSRPSLTGTVKGLKPGTYVVTAGSDDDVWQSAWYGPPSKTYDRSRATPITITPGQNARITITLRYWPNGEPPDAGDGDEPSEAPAAPTPTPMSSPTPDAG